MSYILEALKEAQKSRDDARVPTLRTVQVEPGVRSARSKKWLMPVLVLAGLGLAAALMQQWLGGDREPLVAPETGEVAAIASDAVTGGAAARQPGAATALPQAGGLSESVPDPVVAQKAGEPMPAERPVAPPVATPVEQTPVEQTPVEQKLVEQTPLGQRLVAQSPVDHSPVEKSPVEQTAVDRTPINPTPVEQIPVEQTAEPAGLSARAAPLQTPASATAPASTPAGSATPARDRTPAPGPAVAGAPASPAPVPAVPMPATTKPDESKMAARAVPSTGADALTKAPPLPANQSKAGSSTTALSAEAARETVPVQSISRAEVSSHVIEDAEPAPVAAALEPEPVAEVLEDKPVPHFRELPYDIQQSLPVIRYSVHLYAAEPSHRMVKIDGRVRREGDTIQPGLVLREITPTGAIFTYRDNVFRVPVNG